MSGVYQRARRGVLVRGTFQFQAVTLNCLQNPLIHCDGLPIAQAVQKLGKQ